jgi:hypothetical protein
MHFFQTLSIRRKLMLIIMVTTCSAILLACAVFLIFDIRDLRPTSQGLTAALKSGRL